MSKLEDDAIAYKRKRGAEKKARQRAGYSVIPVEVHLRSVAQMLFAEGLLAERDLDNADAIAKATAEHLVNHQRAGRILKDRTEPPRPALEKGVQDISDWVFDLEFDHKDYEDRQKKLARRLDEQGPGPEFYEGPSVPDQLRYHERRGKGGHNGSNVGYRAI